MYLLDKNNNRIGEFTRLEKISGSTPKFEGEIILLNASRTLIEKFREFEDLANDQVFSLLDQVAEELDKYGFKLSDGSVVTKIQLMNKNEVYLELEG